MRLLAIVFLPALLAGCVSGRPIEVRSVADAGQFAAAETVTVTLANFDFTPAMLRLRAGKPYVLRIENQASGGHDFTAPEFFAASAVLAADAPRLKQGKLEVPGGTTATVHLVPAKGSYKLVCTHFGHAALGMSGTIEVE